MADPPTKKKKTWNPEDMKTALAAVSSGSKIKTAARNFNVPESSLRDRMRLGEDYNPPMGRKTTFTDEEEKEICEYVKLSAKKFYGITQQQLRKLVYDFAVAKNIKNNFSTEKGMAGKCFVYAFLKRNPGISLRLPEPTSLNRVLGFNKAEIDIFFGNLETLMAKYSFPANRIFNVDETGITSVQKPGKIYAPTGLKQVGKATSAERGQNVTVVCAFSATGIYIPPMFIYRRLRFTASLSTGGPPEAIYHCSKSGWINEELFFKWLQHFAQHCGAHTQNPTLLVLDNHSSHQSLSAYEFCRENGIHILSLPPHTSHKMQPLDVTFYGPLKSGYNRECDLYMKMHPFEKITDYHLASIFNKAYTRVATMEKATKGFQVTGIYPLNPHIFDDEEILTANPIIVEPAPSGHVVESGNPSSQNQPIIDHDDSTRSLPPSPTIFDELLGDDNSDTPMRAVDRCLESTREELVQELTPLNTRHAVAPNKSKPSSSRQILEELSPIPEKIIKMKRRVKKQHSTILTATPLKEQMEQKEERRILKNMKIENKTKGKNVKGKNLAKGKSVKRKVFSDTENSEDEPTITNRKKETSQKKTVKNGQGKRITKRRPVRDVSSSSCSESNNIPIANLCNDDEDDDLEIDDLCAICGEFGRDREMWFRCCSCSNWIHKECSGKESAENFICDLCD